MKLYMHPISTPALTALFSAHATGAEFEKHQVDLAAGEQRSPEYLAINPAGRVPALQDGDFYLAESGAVSRYLAKKTGSPLYPSDIKAQARVEQWTDYAAHSVRDPMNRIQFHKLVAPMLGQEGDPSAIAMGEHLLSANLPTAEGQLTENTHLCGDELSLADIALTAALDPAEALGVDLGAYPNITAWRERMRASDWYQAVHTHFGAEIGF